MFNNWIIVIFVTSSKVTTLYPKYIEIQIDEKTKKNRKWTENLAHSGTVEGRNLSLSFVESFEGKCGTIKSPEMRKRPKIWEMDFEDFLLTEFSPN